MKGVLHSSWETPTSCWPFSWSLLPALQYRPLKTLPRGIECQKKNIGRIFISNQLPHFTGTTWSSWRGMIWAPWRGNARGTLCQRTFILTISSYRDDMGAVKRDDLQLKRKGLRYVMSKNFHINYLILQGWHGLSMDMGQQRSLYCRLWCRRQTYIVMLY